MWIKIKWESWSFPPSSYLSASCSARLGLGDAASLCTPCPLECARSLIWFTSGSRSVSCLKPDLPRALASPAALSRMLLLLPTLPGLDCHFPLPLSDRDPFLDTLPLFCCHLPACSIPPHFSTWLMVIHFGPNPTAVLVVLIPCVENPSSFWVPSPPQIQWHSPHFTSVTHTSGFTLSISPPLKCELVLFHYNLVFLHIPFSVIPTASVTW